MIPSTTLQSMDALYSASTTERVIDKIPGLILPGEQWTVKEITEEIPGHSVESGLR